MKLVRKVKGGISTLEPGKVWVTVESYNPDGTVNDIDEELYVTPDEALEIAYILVKLANKKKIDDFNSRQNSP